jgi:hypothetical protein
MLHGLLITRLSLPHLRLKRSHRIDRVHKHRMRISLSVMWGDRKTGDSGAGLNEKAAERAFGRRVFIDMEKVDSINCFSKMALTQRFDGMILQLRGKNLVSEDPEADDVGAGWHGTVIVNNCLGVEPVDENAESFWARVCKGYFLTEGFGEVTVECGVEIGRVVADEVLVNEEALLFSSFWTDFDGYHGLLPTELSLAKSCYAGNIHLRKTWTRRTGFLFFESNLHNFHNFRDILSCLSGRRDYQRMARIAARTGDTFGHNAWESSLLAFTSSSSCASASHGGVRLNNDNNPIRGK